MLGKILGENSVSVIIKKHYYTYVRILELDIKGGLLLSPKNQLTFPIHRRIDPESGEWLRLWLMIKLFQRQKQIPTKATKWAICEILS